MVINFIATRTTMDRFLVVEWRRGLRVPKWWWEQDGSDVGGIRTAARKAEWMEAEEETDGRDMDTD